MFQMSIMIGKLLWANSVIKLQHALPIIQDYGKELKLFMTHRQHMTLETQLDVEKMKYLGKAS